MDWREALAQWKQNENITTITQYPLQQRHNFIRYFPKENLNTLTIEHYALGGKNSPTWIELEKKYLGKIPGYSDKTSGIYCHAKGWRYDTSFQAKTLDQAFDKIKRGFIGLVEAVDANRIEHLDSIANRFLGEKNDILKIKFLYLYYPELFIPIFQDLDYFLKLFTPIAEGRALEKNLRLHDHLKSLPEFNGFDSWGMMKFLNSFKEKYAHAPSSHSILHNNKPYSEPLSYSFDDLEKSTSLDSDTLEKLIRACDRKKQIILYGCPGAGKTFLAGELAKSLTSESDGLIETVQFHPAYTYEDFIQGLRPQTDDRGNLTYQIVAGRFLEFCENARKKDGNCVFIIDEINRANLAAVFGELMYLLEYRDRPIKLAGSPQPFSIPENVYIIGTMNTADRSIALVDHALRRRFAFIELRPDYNVLRQWHKRQETGYDVSPLIAVIEKINDAIGDRHYHLGISFFLDAELGENLPDIWEWEIYPYLEEYFYDNPEQCAEFTWEKVKTDLS